MKSLRFGFSKTSRALFSAALAIFSATAVADRPLRQPAASPARKAIAAPNAPARGGVKALSRTRPAPAAAPVSNTRGSAPQEQESSGHLEFADAYPSTTAAAPDLLLSTEAQRKAEAQAIYAKALIAEDNAETDEALTGYRRVLELDPSNSELAVRVAYELARRNDVPGGIQVLKDAIKASPKEAMPLVYLSQLYSKHLKKPDLALKYAEQALSLAPDTFHAHLALFELHMAAGQPKKAEETLDRAAKSKSTDPKYWIQVGDLYTRLFLKEDGASHAEELERMNAVYRRAAELDKEDATIQAKVADYFVLSRQVKEAIGFYLAALNARKAPDDFSMSNVREKLGRAFLITQQRDEAIKMLEQVIAESPMRFETYELLGELYEQKGERDKALASFEQSLLIDGTRPDNYLRVADMYAQQGRVEKAVEVMKSARAKFPDLPQVTFALALTLSQAKRHTEAMTAFAEAQADAEGSHGEMLNSRFYFQYGAAAEQAGLMDKAAELLRESIRLDPTNSAEALNYLGYSWVDRGLNLDEAGELIKRALEMDSENGAFRDSLGWYYYKKGEHEKALKELLRAAEIIPQEDAVVFDHIADTYLKLGKTAEALSYWQKALVLEPENTAIAEKLEAAKQKLTQSARTTGE